MDSSQHIIEKELRRQNAELRKQNEILSQNCARQSDLLAIIAHDLKNPLTSITLTTTFLEQRWQKMSLQDIMRNLGKIEQSALHLLEISNRLLTVSALEASEQPVSLEPVEIVNEIALLVNDYRSRAAVKDIQIYFDSFIPPTISIMLNRGIVREIAENLLSNAIKYSPFGKGISIQIIGSHISAYKESPYEDILEFEPIENEELAYNFIRLEIRDEGPGFTSEDKRMLFKKFAKLSAQTTNGEDSTGLGLWIAKKLAETVNASIWCHSEEGKGALFIVELPVINYNGNNITRDKKTTSDFFLNPFCDANAKQTHRNPTNSFS